MKNQKLKFFLVGIICLFLGSLISSLVTQSMMEKSFLTEKENLVLVMECSLKKQEAFYEKQILDNVKTEVGDKQRQLQTLRLLMSANESISKLIDTQTEAIVAINSGDFVKMKSAFSKTPEMFREISRSVDNAIAMNKQLN